MSGYRIPEIAKQYTDYDMITIHTDLPNIPESRTRLLYAFLEKDEEMKQSSELYTLVVSLLQMGMDTHDLVSVSNDNKEKSASRERQLKVLAGDYFSSRFYQLLSKSNDIELIKILSASICETNRLKMMLYMKIKSLHLRAEEYLQLKVQMKSQLLLGYTNLISEANRSVWPEIVDSLIRSEVLLEELYRLESASDFRESYGFWYIMHKGSREDRKGLQHGDWDYTKLRAMVHKYRISSHLNEQLESCYRAYSVKAHDCVPESLKNDLLLIGEPYKRFITKTHVSSEI